MNFLRWKCLSKSNANKPKFRVHRAGTANRGKEKGTVIAYSVKTLNSGVHLCGLIRQKVSQRFVMLDADWLIPTTTVAAPAIVPVSKGLRQGKKGGVCLFGWGKCIQKDDLATSTCCSADYKFTCCDTALTTEATTVTTTLLPEQKLEKAYKDAATLCQCKWKMRQDGWVQSQSLLQGGLIKKNTTELILELRAKDECKTANFTCFCDVSNYEGWRGLKFTSLRPQLHVPDTLRQAAAPKKPDRNPCKHLPIPHAEPPQSTTNSEICPVPPSQPIVIAASSLHPRRSCSG
uniref:SMB domain-containing protein n=1 Tax=Globodera rostochiensis TaxID=31243 RepID=A0A914H702_GLORO